MPRSATPEAVRASYTNALTINRIRLPVRLGYEKEERKTRQPVEVDITFFFPALLPSSLKDVGDFICYDKISRLVKALCDKKEFRLIEFLGTQIHRTVRAAVPRDVKILVKITKCGVPVDFILGGATFVTSDLPPFSWVVPQ